MYKSQDNNTLLLCFNEQINSRDPRVLSLLIGYISKKIVDYSTSNQQIQKYTNLK